MAQPRTAFVWFRDILLTVVILTFVAFLVPSNRSAKRTTVAEIDGERVGVDVYDFHRGLFQDQEREFRQRGIDAKMTREYFDRQALERMISSYVLAQEARKLGFEVSDEEVRAEICNAAMFQRDGRCSREQVTQFARRMGFDTLEGYTEMIRKSLLIVKLRRLSEQSVRVSDDAARAKLERDRTTVKLRYAAARPSAFRDRVKVSDEQVKALLDSDSERVRKAYDDRLAEYQKPEEIRARQILFRGENAKERASKATERLSAGEDFVKLASELSDDEATKATGGDLGWIARGRMQPAFDQAAFAGTTNTIIGPIETADGVLLVRVEDRHAAVDRKLEDVRLELARDLLTNDLGRQESHRAAVAMASALEAGKDFAIAAQEAGLTVGETAAFSASTTVVPGIGRVAGLVEAAFALRSEAPNSAQIFTATDTDYLVSLKERTEPDPAALKAELAKAKEALTQAVRNRLFDDWYQARRSALESDGRISVYMDHRRG